MLRLFVVYGVLALIHFFSCGVEHYFIDSPISYSSVASSMGWTWKLMWTCKHMLKLPVWCLCFIIIIIIIFNIQWKDLRLQESYTKRAKPKRGGKQPKTSTTGQSFPQETKIETTLKLLLTLKRMGNLPPVPQKVVDWNPFELRKGQHLLSDSELQYVSKIHSRREGFLHVANSSPSKWSIEQLEWQSSTSTFL